MNDLKDFSPEATKIKKEQQYEKAIFETRNDGLLPEGAAPAAGRLTDAATAEGRPRDHRTVVKEKWGNNLPLFRDNGRLFTLNGRLWYGEGGDGGDVFLGFEK